MVLRNFSRVKVKKVSVRIPKLRIGRKTAAKLRDNKVPLSSIIRILISNAVEDSKKEAKKERSRAEEKPCMVIKEDKPDIAGGYGTIPKTYGTSPQKSYADYGKLFSYLGKFRARNAYENFEAPAGHANNFLEQSSRSLVDAETMSKGARYARYFAGAGVEVNFSSLVPIASMSSGEWEQFKLWMKLDPVMYRLKTSTS